MPRMVIEVPEEFTEVGKAMAEHLAALQWTVSRLGGGKAVDYAEGGYLLHSGNRCPRPGREPHIGFRRRRPRHRALSPPGPIANALFLQRSNDAT